MQDTALHIQLAGSPLYSPKNSDNLFRGPVSVRQALTHSINTIAIQLGAGAGYEAVANEAKRLGLTSRVAPYPSSMIGASVVKPIELRTEPFLVRRVADPSGRVLFDARAKAIRTISPEVAFLVTDMLKDAAEKGTGGEARERLPARVPMAGKTGTTDDATDVWYVGFTPEIVTAVWIGFDSNKPIGEGAYGGTLAAPIWGEMMRGIYAKRPAPATWTVPGGLVAVATDPMTGQPAVAPACPATAGKLEYFIAGSEPDAACVVRPATTPARPDSLPSDSVSLDSLLLGEPIGADSTQTR
jgi:penicillin-binding protein 1A